MCTRTVTVSVPSSHAHLADFKEIYVFHHVLKKCVYLTHLATPGSQATATRVQKCLKIQFLSGFGRASFLHLLGKAQKTGEKTSSPLPGGSANKPLRCLAVKRCQHKGERQVPRPRRRSLRGQHSFSRHNGQPAAPGKRSISQTPIPGPCPPAPQGTGPGHARGPERAAHIWRLQLCPRLRAPRRGGRGSRTHTRGRRRASPLAEPRLGPAPAGGGRHRHWPRRPAAPRDWLRRPRGRGRAFTVRCGRAPAAAAAAAGSGSAGEKPRRAMA